MYRILIVDDEPMIVEGLCALFEEQDAVQLEVYKACLAAEALGIMNRRRIDILLTDIRMPAVSGIELMQRVRANWPACRIIFLTAFEEFEYAYAALKNPGVRFLLKTESHEAILRAVSECVAELEAVLREKLLRQRSAEQSGVIRALRARELFSRLLHVGEAEVTQALLDELGLPLCTGEPVYLLLGLPAAPQEEALLQMDRITGGLTVRAGTKARCAAHKDGSGVLVWFLQENRAEMAEITQALPVLLADELEAMEAAYQADTVFVLAARPCAWDQLAHAYQRLKAVLHLKASAGKRLVYVADGEETSAGESEALRRSEACKRRIRQLGAALEAGDGPAAAAALRNVCACILEIGAPAKRRALAVQRGAGTAGRAPVSGACRGGSRVSAGVRPRAGCGLHREGEGLYLRAPRCGSVPVAAGAALELQPQISFRSFQRADRRKPVGLHRGKAAGGGKAADCRRHDEDEGYRRRRGLFLLLVFHALLQKGARHNAGAVSGAASPERAGQKITIWKCSYCIIFS